MVAVVDILHVPVEVVVVVVPTTGTNVVLRCFGTTNASDGTQSTITITDIVIIIFIVSTVVLLDTDLLSLCVIIFLPLFVFIGVDGVNDTVVGIFVIAFINRLSL